MEPDKETTYFKQVTFFADLPEEEIKALSSATKRRTFRASEVIFHRDDPGQVLYMIKEEKVKISIISTDGQEVSLSVLSKGEYCGEFAFLYGFRHAINAVALEIIECYCLQLSDCLNRRLKIRM